MTWEEEGKKIQEIFKSIKGIIESWDMQSYPAAPDPNLYIEKIEEEIKEYWKIGEEMKKESDKKTFKEYVDYCAEDLGDQIIEKANTVRKWMIQAENIINSLNDQYVILLSKIYGVETDYIWDCWHSEMLGFDNELAGKIEKWCKEQGE